MKENLIVFAFFAAGVAIGYADIAPAWLLSPDLPMALVVDPIGRAGTRQRR